MFEKELKEFGDNTINDLVANYIRMGLKAFGTFERETKSIVSDRRLIIEAPYHARIMQDGREPGKAPPPEAILKWVRLGKIVKRGKISDESLAYLIGRKIAREGIKVPNKYNIGGVISDILTDGRIEELTEELLSRQVEEIKFETINRYEKAS